MKFKVTTRTNDQIVTSIKEVLDNYVQPAVEQHGGSVNFISFDNGILTLEMSGACSGCAGSMATLQHGIEGMMKHHVPEVTEIQAEHDPHSLVDPYYQYDDSFYYHDYENDN
mgnify:CR=1 FL=1|tara:strand:- start:506 stop:841 length:336 start_codon:yes stop_codon:yes gene_type:complete